MGYYTTVFGDIKIEKVDEFIKEVNRIKNILDEAEKNEEKTEYDWFLYYWDISVDNNGFIEFEEAYRKWYEEEEFYNWLLQFNPKGSLILIGESLDSAVVIFKDGKWKLYDIWDAVKCLEKHS